jgi:hypothetical protein
LINEACPRMANRVRNNQAACVQLIGLHPARHPGLSLLITPLSILSTPYFQALKATNGNIPIIPKLLSNREALRSVP